VSPFRAVFGACRDADGDHGDIERYAGSPGMGVREGEPVLDSPRQIVDAWVENDTLTALIT
jgi:hypothetical protein